MKERPIIFSGPMVTSILRGEKTQTRRVMNPQPSDGWEPHAYDDLHKMVDGEFVFRNEEPVVVGWGPVDEEGYEGHRSPFGQPGDRLWVREAWRVDGEWSSPDKIWVEYRSDEMTAVFRRSEPGLHRDPEGKWRPSIHMPRWASRLTLEVVSVRVERLQAITEEDARAEGITDGGCLNCGEPEPCVCAFPTPDARDAFIGLWESVNGEKPGCNWFSDPWVWVIEFRQVTP